MAQGEFTKEEVIKARSNVLDLYDELPKSNRMEYSTRMNDVLLFLSAARGNAPETVPEPATIVPEEV